MAYTFKKLLLITSILLIASSCTRQCSSDHDHASIRQVRLLVWGEYTSQELFDTFTKATGIKVIESNFASNEELLAKIQTGADGYDLIIPSDYMVPVMISLALLTPLDSKLIPNAANIDPSLMAQAFDPKNQWSLPYSWAVTGITYNKTKLSTPISGYFDLLSRQDISLRFSLLDDCREAFGAALKSVGQSVNATDLDVLASARDILIKAKPRVREFTSTPSALLESGDLLAAQMYSNESLRLMSKNKDFQFVVPSDGYTLAIDNFAIPRTARNKAEAHELINFLLNPENNLIFSEKLLTAPVIKGLANQLPQNIKSHPALASYAEVKMRGEMLRDLGDTIRTFDRMWTEVKVADP